MLSVNGSSNLKGGGVGVTLEGPYEILIKQSLKSEFRERNNQAEYEALIEGLNLERDIKVESLQTRTDSLLVVNQVRGEYQVKDAQLAKYLNKVRQLISKFKTMHTDHVPRDRNEKADILSKLASTIYQGNYRSIIHETLA